MPRFPAKSYDLAIVAGIILTGAPGLYTVGWAARSRGYRMALIRDLAGLDSAGLNRRTGVPLSAVDELSADEILTPIAAGGTREVYRDRESALKRDVSLKVFDRRLTGMPQLCARV